VVTSSPPSPSTAHIHFQSAAADRNRLAYGVTTLLGGGTAANRPSNATTCQTPRRPPLPHAAGARSLPVNLGFFGKGNAITPRALEEARFEPRLPPSNSTKTGAPDPAAIDSLFKQCQTSFDIQVCIHSDTHSTSGLC